MSFGERYKQLNNGQRDAVDTIEGPVMVVAGPGTGKTELLSMRVANILRVTDTLPENILCLTFTDSGANSMRNRLAEIIGRDAYRVAVHTFHSFGAEIINQNGQYFYQGASFRLADELNSYEIMRSIFDDLDHSNPLSSQNNNEYTYLNDAIKTISELKTSGLTSDELLAILDQNNIVIEKVEQILGPIFDGGINKSITKTLATQIDTIREIEKETPDLISFTPLSKIIAGSLKKAINEAGEINKTTPITAWRNKWFKKDTSNNYILKSHERQTKLRALSFVYDQYLNKMHEASLYDYDDMILRVVHAMEVFNDLRFNLQEKYQYILVDEFQDTNMAQMRILQNLTNNEVQDDTPNIMVVGDDDQAIYSFQGADISNIIEFRNNYPRTRVISLNENYRSVSKILTNSRNVIVQGANRLENALENLDKQLSANQSDGRGVFIHEADTSMDERRWLVDSIKKQIKDGTKPSDITVLTRRHKELVEIIPYFADAGIQVNYERQDNVLDQEPVQLIEKLSRLIVSLSQGRHDDVNAALPDILSHPMWGISPEQLWKLSLAAFKSRSYWLEIMGTMPEYIPLRDWLISTSSSSANMPLEQIMDIIIGKTDVDPKTEFVSPIYNYYFSDEKLKQAPDAYLINLEALRTIRSKLREHQSDENLKLKAFVDFIELSRRIGVTLKSTRAATLVQNSVNLMTAHKSKGMEFEKVYIINAIDTVWGEHARKRNRLIDYPENLPLAVAGETSDERLRLFYVAMTRAKKELNISYSLSDNNGKSSARAVFLVDSEIPFKKINKSDSIEQITKNTEISWHESAAQLENNSLHDLLKPALDNYKLSITHLQNFLDVTRGGPSTFLIQNLLRFPKAKNPSASYGTAIHEVLQNAHNHYRSTGKKQAVEDVVSNFEKLLGEQRLDDTDFKYYLEKGSDNLQKFLDKNYSTFTPTQQTELNFANQQSVVGTAHLTGKLDLVDINKDTKTMSVTDYKTGKPSLSWRGYSDYEKIKLHKYQQQLMFYKLMIEKSRDYSRFHVNEINLQFVEPAQNGEIVSLDANFSDPELNNFTKLINIVWRHIINLDLPDTSGYEANYKGILAFESALLEEDVDF